MHRHIRLSVPDTGKDEINKIIEVFNSKIIASGRYVSEFENRFAELIGSKYAVATTSGTTALFTAMLGTNIGSGDRVITTPFSFIASSNSILFTGARPVFADINEHDYNIDPGACEHLLKREKKVKAILVVHLFGNPCKMDDFKTLCRKYNVMLLEDCAQSHLAAFNGKRVGCFGSAGMFSFYATKNVTTAEGGIVTTNNRSLERKFRKIINHGRTGRYSYDMLGYNFRMTNIQAGIGLCQLDKIHKNTRKRRKNAAYLSKNLMKCDWIKYLPAVTYDNFNVFHQYTIRIGRRVRKKLIEHLKVNGIDAAIIYPQLISEQPFYRKMGYVSSETPIALKLSREVLSLPVHQALSIQDLNHIIKTFNKFKP